MDESKGFNKVIVGVKKAITAKAIISAASIGMFIPFVKLIYWVFDTSYLGGFGISPDIYSRPIFASGFVSMWLVVESLGVMIVGWSILALVIFIILTSVNLNPNENALNTEISAENEGEVIYAQSPLWDRICNFIERVSDAAKRSVDWPTIIWISGLLLILLLMSATIWASKKGSELAKIQRDFYIDNGFCADKFNSSNIGCFVIDGVEGTGHFVIANSKTHVIYLSKRCTCIDNCKYGADLTILEKTPNAQYSITRSFVSRSNVESDADNKVDEIIECK